jgi:hypothetical protein
VKRLKNSNARFQDVVAAISDLQSALDQWYSSLPARLIFTVEGYVKPSPGLHPDYMLYLYYSYQSSLMAIHSVLVHPWNKIALDYSPHEINEVHRQISRSTDSIAEASRCILRAVKHTDISPSTPKRFLSPQQRCMTNH